MKINIFFFALICYLVSFSAEAQQALYINEFLAINTNCCTDEYGDNDDWVELYNAGSESINIGGMYITDDLANPTMWQIPTRAPDSTTILPGGFLIIWCDNQFDQGIFHVAMRLSGNGEQLGLYAADGITPIDTLTFGSQQADISYGRTSDGGPDWDFFIKPTPGASNVQNITYVNLFINEFLAINDSCYPDEYGEYEDWIELYNGGTDAVDIGGMFITDSLPNPTTWHIPTGVPDSTIIPPDGFLVLWCDNQSEQGVLHIELKLSGNGEQIGLFAPDGITPIDAITFGQQYQDISYGRVMDGGNNWVFFANPTLGKSNVNVVIPTNLFINEFLAINDSFCTDEYGDWDDWIEIYNAGTEAVDIGGMYITDDLLNTTLCRLPTTAPDSTTILPGGFLVLWCDNEPEQGILHVEIRLSGNGEQIGLYAADGVTPIDTFTYEVQYSNTSYGRLPDGSDNWQFFTSPTVGKSNSITNVNQESEFNQIPTTYFMSQNYPNPFNPITQISYQISVPTNVSIKIYNLQGEEIRILVNEYKPAGSHVVIWTGLDNEGLPAASGIYLCHIKTGKFNQTRKMLMIK